MLLLGSEAVLASRWEGKGLERPCWSPRALKQAGRPLAGDLWSRLAQGPAAEGPRGEFGAVVGHLLGQCDRKEVSPPRSASVSPEPYQRSQLSCPVFLPVGHPSARACRWWSPLQGLWKPACGQVSYSACGTAANTTEEEPLRSCSLSGFAALAQLAAATGAVVE